jgi:hypothetical protein
MAEFVSPIPEANEMLMEKIIEISADRFLI